jgi:uncharacterized protein with PIN domain
MNEGVNHHFNSKRITARRQRCIRCGRPMVHLPRKLVEIIYGKDGDVKGLTKMCENCRRKATWEDGALK